MQIVLNDPTRRTIYVILRPEVKHQRRRFVRQVVWALQPIALTIGALKLYLDFFALNIFFHVFYMLVKRFFHLYEGIAHEI